MTQPSGNNDQGSDAQFRELPDLAEYLAYEHQMAQQHLAAKTAAGLALLWPILDFRDLDKKTDQWLHAVTLQVEQSFRASSALSNDFVQGMRWAVDPGSEPIARVEPVFSAAQVQKVMGINGPVAVKKLSGSPKSYSPDQMMNTGLSDSTGAGVSSALDGGRRTVQLSMVQQAREAAAESNGSGDITDDGNDARDGASDGVSDDSVDDLDAASETAEDALDDVSKDAGDVVDDEEPDVDEFADDDETVVLPEDIRPTVNVDSVKDESDSGSSAVQDFLDKHRAWQSQPDADGESIVEYLQKQAQRKSGHADSGDVGDFTDRLASRARKYGYKRMTDDRPCYFCAILASKGNFYINPKWLSDSNFKGEGDAKVHNHCRCMLVPVFSESEQYDSRARYFLSQWFKYTRQEDGTQLGGRAALNEFRRNYVPPPPYKAPLVDLAGVRANRDALLSRGYSIDSKQVKWFDEQLKKLAG